MRDEIQTSAGTELAPEEKTDSFTIKFPTEDVGSANTSFPTRLSMGDEVEAWDQRLLRLRRRPQLGIASGLPELDRATSGLRGMWLLTGEAGGGKTSLALQIGVEAVRADPAVALLYVSLESSRWDLYDRVAARLAKLEHRVLLLGRRGDDPLTQEEKDRIADARGVMGEIGGRVRIIDVPAADLSESHIEYELRSLTSVEGRRPLVIIDSMDAWVAGRASSAEAEHERVESMKNVRTLVGESGALLVISEPSGISSSDALITATGSARRAAAPDVVLALKKADDRDMVGAEEGVTALELNVLKGRDGVTTGGVGLDFYYRENRFQPR